MCLFSVTYITVWQSSLFSDGNFTGSFRLLSTPTAFDEHHKWGASLLPGDHMLYLLVSKTTPVLLATVTANGWALSMNNYLFFSLEKVFPLFGEEIVWLSYNSANSDILILACLGLLTLIFLYNLITFTLNILLLILHLSIMRTDELISVWVDYQE